MLYAGCRLASICSGLIVLFIGFFLFKESLPLLLKINPMRFLNDPGWHPTEGQFGLFPMFAGSLLITVGAMIVAAPLGIILAVFCRFFAPRKIANAYQALLSVLSGIPSVVFGLWGLVVLAPIIRHVQPPGVSLLAGVLVLAVMILPTIALSANAAMTSVPFEYLQGAAALGFSKWQRVWGVAIPAARPGIVTGMILGAGRAIGETMVVLMVCGNVVQVPDSVFDPVRTLTANIALEMSYALSDHRAALFVSGLMLLFVVMGFVAISESIRAKVIEK